MVARGLIFSETFNDFARGVRRLRFEYCLFSINVFIDLLIHNEYCTYFAFVFISSFPSQQVDDPPS
jgi:hypothetical protein